MSEDNVAVPKRSSGAYCRIHSDTKLICPRCIGSRGGKATITKHRKKLSRWGKAGGRPRNK